MTEVNIKAGDTARPWTDVLKLGGTAINLSGATVKLRIEMQQPSGARVERDAVVTNPAEGRVSYQPIAEDVETPGKYALEWAIEFANGSRLTVPSEGQIILHVAPVIAEA